MVCSRIAIGEEGRPQGVFGWSVAARVKSGRWLRPVPPMTAMRTGSGGKVRRNGWKVCGGIEGGFDEYQKH